MLISYGTYQILLLSRTARNNSGSVPTRMPRQIKEKEIQSRSSLVVYFIKKK